MAAESVTASTATPPTTSGRPRPKLKGHHEAFMKRHLYIGIGLALAGVIATKFLVNEPRKKAYADYYKTYDPYAHLERMRKAGLLQSASPDDDD